VFALLQQRHTEKLNYAMLLQQQRDSLLHLQHARVGEAAAQAEAERLRRERDLLSDKQNELLGLYSYLQGRARMLEEKYDECQQERLQLGAECRQLRRNESDRLRQTRDWHRQTCKREEEEGGQQDGQEQQETQIRGWRRADGSHRAQRAETADIGASDTAADYLPPLLPLSPYRSHPRAERDAPQHTLKRPRISLQQSPPAVSQQPANQRVRPPSFYTLPVTPISSFAMI
jgi:hypothetical protein